MRSKKNWWKFNTCERNDCFNMYVKYQFYPLLLKYHHNKVVFSNTISMAINNSSCWGSNFPIYKNCTLNFISMLEIIDFFQPFNWNDKSSNFIRNGGSLFGANECWGIKSIQSDLFTSFSSLITAFVFLILINRFDDAVNFNECIKLIISRFGQVV